MGPSGIVEDVTFEILSIARNALAADRAVKRLLRWKPIGFLSHDSPPDIVR
jgi:hypothetical protein